MQKEIEPMMHRKNVAGMDALTYKLCTVNKAMRYSYDAQGRLTKSVKTNNLKPTDAKTVSYGYDAVGNRRTESDNGTLSQLYYNGLNQLTLKQGGSPATTVNYFYDANGNQVTEKTGNNAVVSFVYDVDNQLTSVKKQTKVINTNTYNSEGQRITKTDSSGQATNYFYQGSVALYTTNASGAKTTFNLLGGSDNTIASKRYQGTQAGKYLTYNKDIRTSTSTLLNDSGTYTLSYDYTDFGETTRLGEQSLINEIAYTGGIYDTDTALYYLNARYYDPDDGRFMTVDTERNGGGVAANQSLYGYCENDPVGSTDPTGQKKKKKAAALIGSDAASNDNAFLDDANTWAKNHKKNYTLKKYKCWKIKSLDELWGKMKNDTANEKYYKQLLIFAHSSQRRIILTNDYLHENESRPIYSLLATTNYTSLRTTLAAGAKVYIHGCNAGGYAGYKNVDAGTEKDSNGNYYMWSFKSIAQYIANGTNRKTYAYLNYTSQKKINGGYYQKPVNLYGEVGRKYIYINSKGEQSKRTGKLVNKFKLFKPQTPAR